MSLSPKHKKLDNAKIASVSLDSLLGLLSSAYGTEELDSKKVFERNSVDWSNLSVENFRTVLKKGKSGEDKKIIKPKEFEKNNVSTSTTNLKVNINCGSEIDVTLVSIKSLESFKQRNHKSGGNNSFTNITSDEINTVEGKHKSKENTSLLSPSELESTQDDAKSFEEGFETENQAESSTFYSFHLDDINHKVTFDIHFTRKFICNQLPSVFDTSEPDIAIYVTDLSKETKSSIKVSKNCLVSKVQFFSDVNEQLGLENLNVIVKCNLNVFQWIVQWLKADMVMCRPTLNINNLKVILSMAYHLGIDILVEECLDFFHNNFQTVFETDRDVEDVFDDNLLNRLIMRFTNAEINNISDDFYCFKMNLFSTLIKMLADAKPCASFGHYSTLATIFQCGFCKKLINNDLVNSVPCKSDCNSLNLLGCLKPNHERLTSWDLSRYIELMHEHLQSWDLVYWRLWGTCHFLNCIECHVPYPICQSDWCPYHPAEVEYFPMNSNTYYPVGMYKCCGEKAFKFNTLEPYGGCKFRSHKPELNSDDKVKMYEIYKSYKDVISCQPPENEVTKKFVKLEKKSANGDELLPIRTPESFWWQGIRLAPQDKKDYSIISQEILNKLKNKTQVKKPVQKHKPLLYEPPVHFGIMPSAPTENLDQKLSTNEINAPQIKKKPKLTAKKSKSSSTGFILGRTKIKKNKLSSSSYSYRPTESVWMKTKSNKDNQDNQRDFEEIAMRSMVNMLTPDAPVGSVTEPAAGSYIRLEAQWWQEHYRDAKQVGNSARNSGTVVNRTFPLSWFRKLTI